MSRAEDSKATSIPVGTDSNWNSADMAAGYARRYTGSYQNRFKSPTSVLHAEKKLIRAVIEESLKAREAGESDQFIILDFAGGGGRLFEEYREILELLKSRELRLKVICYDVTGLDVAYQKILDENGFVRIRSEEKEAREARMVETVGTYHNPVGDMEFKFVRGPAISRRDNFDDVSELVKAEVGIVDASISVFGGISHIMGRDNRQKVLRTINDQTRGYFGVTLPSLNVHKKEVEAYDVVRGVRSSLGLEKGDAEYLAEDGNPYPYHHYDMERLHEDFVAAGFPKVAKFEIANIGHPLGLHKSVARDSVDSFVAGVASRVLPDAAQDKIASYFQVLSPSAVCHARQQTSGIVSKRHGALPDDAAKLLDEGSGRGRVGGCAIM